jgi:uncharacterized protein
VKRGAEIRAVAAAVRLEVRAKPRAKTSRLVSVEGLRVEVALAAAPVDGAANAELLSVLAGVLGVPRRDLFLAHGAGSRSKVVRVQGLGEDEVVTRLSAALSR